MRRGMFLPEPALFGGELLGDDFGSNFTFCTRAFFTGRSLMNSTLEDRAGGEDLGSVLTEDER